MSLTEIRNVVLLFSNPVWSGTSAPDTVIRNITALSSQLAYEETVQTNLTTLTTNNAETLNGIIQGLLYVPTIATGHPCVELEKEYLPRNVTRQENLPPANYKLIALAPWFNTSCTQAYLESAREDPIRGFIFYRPNNSSSKPQDVDSPVWDLEDGGLWRDDNHFPIFAVSGIAGQDMMTELGRYSGSVADVPHGAAIMELYGPNPRDYVRVWAELKLENPSDLPAMWTYFTIVIGSLTFVIIIVSLTMHLVNRSRRQSLQRRVESGEVDLEAMGIKRLTVPLKHIEEFPLYTYLDVEKYEERKRAQEAMSSNSPPQSPQSPQSPRSEVHTSRSGRGSKRRNGTAPTSTTMVSDSGTAEVRLPRKRSNITRSKSTMATNYQPQCHICLEAFQEHITVIRQLPCGHIFHHDCIDEFLSLNSSLCPICKQCMLPLGFCPKITNGMVRRERAMRQLRSRVHLDEDDEKDEDGRSGGWMKKIFPFSSSRDAIPLTPIPVSKSPKSHQGESSGAEPDADLTQPRQRDSSSEPQETHNRGRRKRNKSRLDIVSEDLEAGGNARTGPSDLARRRMQDLAEHIDDPDQTPLWKRAVSRIFPRL